jgi:hypothetical protein
MSLVGNLEDLSLGDILQIISLSQKSGVLALVSGQGAGRIVFRGGLVEAACVKGAPDNLRDLLISLGEVEPAAFDRCAERARELGETVDEVLARESGLESPEDVLVSAVVERFDPPEEVGLTVAEVEAAMPLADGVKSEDRGVPRQSEGSAADVDELPVVLIDPDVVVLDWAKSSLRGRFARVHVFQQAEQGLSRIRQYLIRGQQPLVLISPETPIDPLSGIHGLADFVKRLKVQAPRIVVLGLRADDADDSVGLPAALDGALVRPARARLTSRSSSEAVAAGEQLLTSLADRVAESYAAGASTKPKASGASRRSASLKGLRDATIRLQEASSRGEILPVVLDFAHDLFDRVAILIVRDESVFAVAGRSIRALEIDPLGSDPAISFPVPESGWVRHVVDQRSPIRGAPGTNADHELLEAFGPGKPTEAYLAPIESASALIAILYGDQATGGAPIPDTHALEVVLQYAGLALDRAALERALWEVDATG